MFFGNFERIIKYIYGDIMTFRFFIALFALVTFIEAGTLKGHVKYDGKAPKPKRLRMDADPVCGSSHTGPVYSENFKMAKNGSMAEALVYLKNVKYNGGVLRTSSIGSKRMHICSSRIWNDGRAELLIRIAMQHFITYTLCLK